ncbi:MAG: aminopeptidase [Proteobacteria bacterium]|nr:aminopeptidase [Pseudomonadota bacterium]
MVGYIARAGYEEAKILINRTPLNDLIDDEKTEVALKEKFKLVLEAREYANGIGLNAKGSFSDYSIVENEDLLWVINACPVDSLAPKTWWFPIVGRIPYRGYFDKQDAEKMEAELKSQNYDTFLRSSSAFSTLGWFDDPLLSTTVKHDHITLVDTVIHEILHNTIWVKNHVPFNESLANFVGAKGAIELYTAKNDLELSTNANNRWLKEIAFAEFLESLAKELTAIYETSKKENLPLEDLKSKKDKIIKARVSQWLEKHGKGNDTKKQSISLNNATIMAQQIYLTKPWIFQELYDLNGSSLKSFIELCKKLADKINRENKPPYELFQEYIDCQKLNPSDNNHSIDVCL